MKKIIILCISLVVLIFIGSYIYLKINPPLVAVQSGTAMERQILLVKVGNKNLFGEIEIQDVLVNDSIKPSRMKVQVSDQSKGFIISDRFDGEEEQEYTFKDLDNIKLQPKTDPQRQLEKVNNSVSTKEDLIYAITLGHQNSIDKAIINYRYLGMSFKKVVSIE
ncbi:hypothetical protein QGM71_14710 [Virgibacillus sp. C22-A2]|uniref:DUF4230 domain-containing protein n=1 Tax=Virgibacillus tibetensis TaxID=3042313 RepID=A0ABU6KHP4_9BACI|nr:hypothetical protein [Virgibacillus sp. C22-A2]